MSRDGSRMVRTLMIYLLNRMSAFAEPPPKRKADVKSSRTPATSLRARNVSPLRKKPRDADFPLRSSGRLHQSKSGGRCARSAHPSNHHDPTVELQAVKRGVGSSSSIPLEVRLAEAKKARESSAREKGGDSDNGLLALAFK
ncbi:hypothetical protein L3X38_026111 [Prunus dulcis]|uniref:Uncharacterized protein n=1 Tax=Prunus dulcis TaxID=3755 RepID=A0AAD4Z721_PRUDU|nr:hypothetical protein L3X38_026111 [Prunus dulcis]